MEHRHITTHAMKEAPKDCLYVWPSPYIGPGCRLAVELGRYDVSVISFLDLTQDRLRGCGRPVVVDHAARITPSQEKLLANHRRRLIVASLPVEHRLAAE